MSGDMEPPCPTAKLPPTSSQPTPELQHLFPRMTFTLFLIFCTLCCFDILNPFGLGDTPPPRAGQVVPTAHRAQAGWCLVQQTAHPDPHVLSLLGTLGGGGPRPRALRGPLCVPSPVGVSTLVHPRLSPLPASCFLQKLQEGPWPRDTVPLDSLAVPWGPCRPASDTWGYN